MQPQDPNNQNSNPTTPPTPPAPAPEPPTPPAAQTPTPSNGPAPAPAPTAAAPIPEPELDEPASSTPTDQYLKKMPSKALIGGILGAIVLIAVAISVYFLFFSGIKLAT